jgi:hypothetical protein
MATIKENLGTVTAITITLASLGSGSWQQSVFVDNATNLFLDAFVNLIVKTGATGAGTVDVWAYASIDAGTSYSDGATGADAAFTPTANPNLTFLGSIQTPVATTSYKSRMFSLAQAFGGSVPQRWGLAIKNTNGSALDSTGGNFTVQYMGLTQTVA